MAAPIITLRIDYQSNCVRVLRKWNENFVPAIRAAGDAIADAFKERVQLAMVNRKGSGPPLSPFTLAKRRAGKSAGRWPAIPAYGGSRPFMRSGALMQSIRRKKTGPLTWQVGPEEGKIMPFSGSGFLSGIMTTDRVMSLLEYGFTVSIPETVRMHRYFRRMYYKGSKSGGSQRKQASGDEKTGRILTVRVPPRPIFHHVHKQMLSEYEDIAMRAFDKRLMKGVTF